MSDFIQQCVSREADLDDIDDFIERWHHEPGDQGLHAFLGMTRQEYALWVRDPSFLPAIVRIRAHGERLDDLRFPAEVLASSKTLTDWLQTVRHWTEPSVR